MAKARIQLREDGGIDVIVPDWGDDGLTIFSISHHEMGEIMAEATEDGASEPNYDELTATVCDVIREALGVNWAHEQQFKAAVAQQIHPGPAFDKIYLFTV